MKMILIRHPETKANRLGHYIGHMNSDYTELGQTQFKTLIHQIDHPIDQLYTSPLPRCKALAEELGKKMNLPIVVEPDIAEVNFGIFEGKHHHQLQKDHKRIWDAWIKDYVHYRLPEGESLWALHRRVQKFLGPLKKMNGTYLCVTHGGVIQSIITILLKLDIEQRWHFKVSPGSIVEISYNHQYGVLEKILTPNTLK